MSKVHLIISSDPVPDGFDRSALCGEIVKAAQAIPLADMNQPASTILFCKACFGRNYFYAISEPQNAFNISRDIEVA